MVKRALITMFLTFYVCAMALAIHVAKTESHEFEGHIGGSEKDPVLFIDRMK